jgi:hypothetical protein
LNLLRGTSPQRKRYADEKNNPRHGCHSKTSLSFVSLPHTILHGLALRLGMTKEWSRQKSIKLYVRSTVRYLVTFLIVLSLILPALSIELFRYQGAAKDGGTLEYVFEAGEQNSPNAVTKEKAAEIAADFITTFYHVQVGAVESQEFRTNPVPFWLICFSDTVKALRQMFFVVVFPNGTDVEPRVARSL